MAPPEKSAAKAGAGAGAGAAWSNRFGLSDISWFVYGRGTPLDTPTQ